MPKPKSSRAAVRTTPQPKAHRYVEAVFTDDFGCERALTARSAASFSKKKLAVAARADRKAERERELAIEAGDRETVRAIRKLRQQERETDRSIARFFRRRIRTAVRPTNQTKHKPPQHKLIMPTTKVPALPSYGGFIRDQQNRIGVFLDIKYFSSRTSRPGAAMRMAKYIWRGTAFDENGLPMFRSNVGLDITEVACGFDHLEQINRSAQKNAKILNTAVLAMDHRWTPQQMLDVGENWAKERFGQFGLPYAVALHEPPPGGDERNWHIHVIWSWRPLERVGDHEWLVSEVLRTDLDGAQGMRILRERFAGLSTLMSFERGDCDVYTALSHAARGLPIETQIKLNEVKTRRARAGEFVADNEENHERVLRSKAALIDDDLRREEERLARRIEIERKVAAMIAKPVPILKAPQIVYKGAKISIALIQRGIEGLPASKAASIAVPSVPRAAPSSPVAGLAAVLEAWRARGPSDKFANLRIPTKQVPPLPEVPPLAMFWPQRLRLRLHPEKVPQQAAAVPMVEVPKARAVPSRMSELLRSIVSQSANVPAAASFPPDLLDEVAARLNDLNVTTAGSQAESAHTPVERQTGSDDPVASLPSSNREAIVPSTKQAASGAAPASPSEQPADHVIASPMEAVPPAADRAPDPGTMQEQERRAYDFVRRNSHQLIYVERRPDGRFFPGRVFWEGNRLTEAGLQSPRVQHELRWWHDRQQALIDEIVVNLVQAQPTNTPRPGVIERVPEQIRDSVLKSCAKNLDRQKLIDALPEKMRPAAFALLRSDAAYREVLTAYKDDGRGRCEEALAAWDNARNGEVSQRQAIAARAVALAYGCGHPLSSSRAVEAEIEEDAKAHIRRIQNAGAASGSSDDNSAISSNAQSPLDACTDTSQARALRPTPDGVKQVAQPVVDLLRQIESKPGLVATRVDGKLHIGKLEPGDSSAHHAVLHHSQVQEALERSRRNQRQFVHDIWPGLVAAVTKSDVDNGSEAVIAKLPESQRAQAQPFAGTALWDLLLRQLEKRGQRSTKAEVKLWRDAFRNGEGNSAEAAARASTHLKKWPIRLSEDVEADLKRDAAKFAAQVAGQQQAGRQWGG